MDILIIGNGFDLAHGLKTSYKDFLDYCEKLPSDNEFLKNLWLRYFWEVKDKKIIESTWIDFETEIYNQICRLSNVVKGTCHIYTLDKNPNYKTPSINAYFIENELGPFPISHNQVLKTNEGKINFIYSQLRDFTKAFERYLTEEISKQLASLEYKLSLSAKSEYSFKVISFNYTDTIEKIYDNNGKGSLYYKIKPVYVHGKANANSDDCKLVLGTHSFDRKNNEVDKKLSMDFNVFQKHNQRHKYRTIEVYQDFLQEITNPRKIIHPVFHVIGHSLDETDHNILKHIFTANKNTKRINIYYHNEEAQEKLIHNITDIIGEAEVMTKVRLIHQHDEKCGLLKHIT